MNACGTIKGDERTQVMLWANTWGLNFLLFALLADIMYRSLIGQTAWDLFGLIILTGLINFAYTAKHHASVINRKSMLAILVSGVVAAVIAAVVALTKTF
jgi:hypothetical protein